MDDFRYIDILGHGAYGMVDEAEHIESGTVVAIKHLMRNNLPPTIGEEFVQHELQVQSPVTHLNIIRPYALFEDESAFHMVMQLFDGELGALMQINGGRLEEADGARILAGLLRAVGHCHSIGIIHRDIKMTNVLLDSEDSALLCDFGESVRVSENELLEDYMQGTVKFMAPEMCNKRPYNHRVDIWSMGAVLYQKLVGKLPFKGRTKQDTIN